MAVTVKAITLWRREVENAPGVLAGTLRTLCQRRGGSASGDGLSLPRQRGEGRD